MPRSKPPSPQLSVASPEHFRAMLVQALSDPETKMLLRKNLVGTAIPVQGGMACGTTRTFLL